MKKQSLWIITAFAFIVLASPACKKHKDTPQKTKTELITQSSWKFDNAKVGGNDVSAFLQTCQKDNILFFSANGTGTVDEGATKCNGGDPQTNPFTWSFLSNETMLHVSANFFSGGSGDITLITLSETQLIGSQIITVNGSSQTAVVTFIH